MAPRHCGSGALACSQATSGATPNSACAPPLPLPHLPPRPGHRLQMDPVSLGLPPCRPPSPCPPTRSRGCHPSRVYATHHSDPSAEAEPAWRPGVDPTWSRGTTLSNGCDPGLLTGLRRELLHLRSLGISAWGFIPCGALVRFCSRGNSALTQCSWGAFPPLQFFWGLIFWY